MADIPDLARTELAIIAATNAFRRDERLGPLTRNAALDQTAKLFASYLAKSGRFAHEADGRQPADRAKASGYRYCTVAENLALNLDSRGFTAEKLSSEAIQGWKESPGHRKNMLLRHVTEIGVGVAQAPGGDPKFLSVQLLAGRKPDSRVPDCQPQPRHHSLFIWWANAVPRTARDCDAQGLRSRWDPVRSCGQLVDGGACQFTLRGQQWCALCREARGRRANQRHAGTVGGAPTGRRGSMAYAPGARRLT